MSDVIEISTSQKSLDVAIRQFVENGADLTHVLVPLLEHSNSLISVVDSNNKVLFASLHHAQLQGVDDDITNVSNPVELLPPNVRERAAHYYAQTPLASQKWDMSATHKDGTTHIYNMLSFPVPGVAESPVVRINFGINNTHNRAYEQALRDHKSQIAYITFHDPLTGLPNRSLFYDRMDKSLSRAKRSNSHLALLLIDLDRFKNINDSLGRDIGDLYLKEVGKQLRIVLRDTDTVARLGGDEFVVILEDIHEPQDIRNIADKILESLAKPLKIEQSELSCTASIGVSLFPKDGNTTEKLLRHADMAMYSAKNAGKNRLQFFLKAMTDTAVNYLLLENDLRKAIDNQELVLFYQPQIDLKTARITGLEALVRWNHPERGMVSPMEFIPLAEETGLIEPIGEWVMREACARFKTWLDAGVNLGKVAVNLSARQFRQDNFELQVQSVLADTQLPAEYLELEITETSIMENASKTVSMLNQLNDMGLSLAIDDFGTGYSSLAYLNKFPIQKLKVDRSFIQDIDHNDNDGAIAKSIIDLGHNMSLQVIAEGVERESQTQWLFNKGCDQVQGFYYSKPLSEADLMRLVCDEKRVCNQDYCVILNI